MAINGRTNASDRDDNAHASDAGPGAAPAGSASQKRARRRLRDRSYRWIDSAVADASIRSASNLKPATVNGSRFFEHVNNHPLNDPRLHLIIDDARTYLRVTPTLYDNDRK